MKKTGKNRAGKSGAASVLALGILFSIQSLPAEEQKITYSDQILPILRNSCLNCHDPDKHRAGLDMTTYKGMMNGSDSGKVIEPGDPDKSLLLRLVTHAEEPAMPPKSDKLPDSQIDLLRKWIEQNAPENSGSVIVKKNSQAGALLAADNEKPNGPPPMPHDLLLEPAVRTARPGTIPSMAASPRAPLIAVAGEKQVLLYDMRTLDLAGVLPFAEGFPQIVRFSRDGRLLIAGGGEAAKWGHVVVWDVTTGERVMEAGEETDAVLAADISADHHLLALGGPGRLVKIFRDGTLVQKIKKHTDWITAIAFSADGKLVASGDRQGNIEVWECATGQEMFALAGHKAGITALLAAGNSLVSASEDGTIKVWDLKEGRQLKSWGAHTGGVLSIALAQDGRLASSGRDKLAKLWDTNGNAIRTFDALPDIATQVAFSNGKVVAAAWTGTLRAWNAADGKRAGDLVANPPTIEEQLQAATRHLSEVQPVRDQCAAAAAAARKSVEESGAAVRAATAALNVEQEKLKAAEGRATAAAKASADAEAALDRSHAEIARLEQSGTLLASGSAQTASGQGPGSAAPDAGVLQTARLAAATAAGNSEKLATEAHAANEEVTQEKQRLATAGASLQKAKEEAAEKSAALAKAAADLEHADQRHAEALAVIAKWKAATLNITVYAARAELASRQAVLDKATAAWRAASAEFDKARADYTAAVEELKAAPDRIREKEAAIQAAREGITKANAAQSAAEELIGKREALAQATADFANRIGAESAGAPEDKSLADAAGKAKESLALLNASVTHAKESAAARTADAAAAVNQLSAAEKALAEAKNRADAGPALVAKLHQSAEDAAARTAAGRSTTGAAVDAAAREVAAAKAKVDGLFQQYQELARQAQPAATAAASIDLAAKKPSVVSRK